MKGTLALLALAQTAQATATTEAVRAPSGDTIPTEVRLDVSQLYTLDDATSRHTSFTDVRGTADAHRELGDARFELHFDGRARRGWTDITPDRSDVTRAYATIGGTEGGWTLGLGRQVILPLDGARVDGASLDLGLTRDLHLVGFGGAMPDPLDGSPNTRFLMSGLAYESRSNEFHNMGGFAADLYQGALDRMYLSERIFWLPSRMWQVHGFTRVDLVDKVDLTSAHLTIRFQPVSSFDISLYGAHNHTILPHLWWLDYLTQERARLGFILDGLEPVGTRRSTARLLANLHLTTFLTPYAAARADYRHEDQARAYEGTGGLKIDLPDIGYLDASASIRNFFGTRNQIASLAIGTNFGVAAGIDANASALRVESPGTPWELLYDLGGTMWVDLRALFSSLGDVRLMATYQAFIQPDVTFQVMMVRIGYRFRTT